MNTRQIVLLLGGAVVICSLILVTPARLRYEWVYYSPYSSMRVDRLSAPIWLVACVTAVGLFLLRTRRR